MIKKNKDKENLNTEKKEHKCCNSENDKCCCKNNCSETTCTCEKNKCKCGCEKDIFTKNQCEKDTDTIQNLKDQLNEWQNKYLLAYADAENAKRRAEIDAKNMVDYKISNFAKDMIPLADNLALAISSIKDSVDPSVLEGLQAIENNFTNALRKNGIEKIETIGKPLNPMEHRVVTQIESDAEENSIVQEFQAGYKIGDKVIREAMVATAKPKQ